MDSLTFTLEGLTPLILDRYHGENGKTPGRRREPEKEAKQALYMHEDGSRYLPADMLWKCLLNGATYHKWKRKLAATVLPGAVEIVTIDLPLEGDWELEERAVINAARSRTIKYFPKFTYWRLHGELRYDGDFLGGDDLLREVFDTAGRFAGLGCFRPSLRGMYGKFRVVEWKSDELAPMARATVGASDEIFVAPVGALAPATAAS